MEQLRSELSLVLGEPLSRLECISEQPYASLYSLYDGKGTAMPVVAKYFNVKGVAAQEAYKLSMLARESLVRLPSVYGLVVSQRSPQHEVLLIERMGGVSVEAPTRTRDRWLQLQEQIVEALLAWHRLDSHGLVGRADSTQENNWTAWYTQRIEVLWSTLKFMRPAGLTDDDLHMLRRSRENLSDLMADFDDPCVLVHGNITLRSMLKEARGDQLLSMINPGMMLWAPREYELFRLSDEGQSQALLFHYLKQAPVAEGFIARRWLYTMWDQVDNMIHTGQFEPTRFHQAAQSLMPWLR
ncbi:YcbJ family phosphotransferase [Erwinia sp. 9145]|uniref:YcbJ family phosphotransferase n=1 Tax=Erwinia sp. 9145 TaxID=1500895 RepID=UPI000553EFA7|nr:YcbJ family phosphotransferase [Erwinia sp. 9145]